MSICYFGLTDKIDGAEIKIRISDNHRLIKLANALPWESFSEIVLPDLRLTTSKLKWWLGRSLQLRTHLGVYLLQQLINATDRGIENQIQDNAAYQIFCGLTIVKNWHCPDHTKIEEFRSRLNPETQCKLANKLAAVAAQMGFADPRHIDIDSTIQEANICYPAPANLLVKLAWLAKRLVNPLLNLCQEFKNQIAEIDMKEIKAKARCYFFIQRKNSATAEAKIQQLKELWRLVVSKVIPVINLCHNLNLPTIQQKLSYGLRRQLEHFQRKALPFLDNCFEHLFNHHSFYSKIYSFHADAIECFNKNKLNKKREFGRTFQLGRLKGNFITVSKCTSIRMIDTDSIEPMVTQHQRLFANNALVSVATDKGYYSKENEAYLLNQGIAEVGLQKPNRKLNNAPNNLITKVAAEKLKGRRAGIEPLIGHLKHGWQLARSRMKSDQTTESSGYCAVLGFNLHQLSRCLTGEIKIQTN
jgi:IS5 family transposase